VSRLTWVRNQGLHIGFGYRTVTFFGPPFQTVRLPILHPRVIPIAPRNPDPTCVRSVWAKSAFARHYSRNRCLLSFPPGTEMFHFPGFASRNYGFITGYGGITRRGFPHSEIYGSKPG
jgi:hypothetical protein